MAKILSIFLSVMIVMISIRFKPLMIALFLVGCSQIGSAHASNGAKDTQGADQTCFVIHDIRYTTLTPSDLTDAKVFGFALLPEISGKGSVLGSCMGVSEIHSVASRVQNRLIEKGFVTTRIMIADQNLSQGELALTLIPGKIGQIITNTQNSPVPVYINAKNKQAAILDTALTTQSGNLLNIRHLETTLDNLKRLPSSQATFQITPSNNTQLGMSDIVIDYQQNKRMRSSISFDDAGSQATGKYQGVITTNIDNLTNHNDLLYLSFGRDLGHDLNKSNAYPNAKGSKNFGLGYVLPMRNSLLQINANHYTYHQTVAGSIQDYVYGGNSQNYTAKLSHLVHRDSKSKSHLHLGAYLNQQQSDIDGTQIEVQTKRTAGFEVGFGHETKLGKKGTHTLNAAITYKKGTRAFNAIAAPEELFNEGSAKAGIYHIALTLGSQYQPTINNQPLFISHNSQLKLQFANQSLIPSQKMAIGGRYTIRGFDGERTLSADNGVLIKQDLSIYPKTLNPTQNNSIPSKIQFSNAIYLGLDAGYVYNNDHAQNELLLGQHLAGAAIGIKGQYTPNTNNPHLSFHYDIFTSKAISQPKGFSKKDWVSGFSVGVGF